MALLTEPAEAQAPSGTLPPGEIKGRSLSQIAWRRLRSDKLALAGLVVIIIYVLAAIFAPLITNLLGIDPFTFHQDLVDQFGFPSGPWGGVSWQHPLGLEPLTGRDLLARILYGARVSLLIAFLATGLSLVIGTIAGTAAGFKGGWVDTVVSRSMDVLLAFPVLLFSLAFLAIIGFSNNFNTNGWRIIFLVFIIGFFGWAYIGRVLRGQTLSLREKEFVDASRSIGSGQSRILFKELTPYLLPILLVYATLVIPANILYEAALSFLGVGLVPPDPTWGQMLDDATKYFQIDPAYMVIPGMTLFICVLAFNLFGDGLRDAFDPRGTS
jgi:peptide/nickel transport system permease protein